MIRYSVNMEDRLIEPSLHGKWVKYEDHAQMEAGIETRAEELALAAVADSVALSQRQTAQIVELTEANETLRAELSTARDGSASRIDRQTHLLRAAKDRLALLGHSPTCGTRYGRTAEGQTVTGECNCGLHEWLREHELG